MLRPGSVGSDVVRGRWSQGLRVAACPGSGARRNSPGVVLSCPYLARVARVAPWFAHLHSVTGSHSCTAAAAAKGREGSRRVAQYARPKWVEALTI